MASRAIRRLQVLLALALLAACSSLPRIAPDMATAPVRPAQIIGALGPLSAERREAVLQRLRAGQVPAGDFERHLALEEALVGRPLTAGNRATLLLDGPDTLQAMLEAIAGAHDHIHFETYIFEADAVGERFAQALLDRQREGVSVALIVDSVGTLATPPGFFERLRDGGVQVLEFNPVNPLTAKAGWNVNGRDHRKLLVVDGRTALLGGVNVSAVYSSAPGGSAGAGGSGLFASRPAGARADEALPWRDTHLRLEGPAVADFQRLFLETWASQRGEPLAPRDHFPPLEARGRDVVRAIGSSPDEPYSAIYATLISAIVHAEREVLLTNAYFVPDPQLLEALRGAAARGVKVRLLLPGTSDSALVFHAGRAHYDTLLAGGVEIHERRGALLHAKTAVIDGVWSTVGSTNLDWRSFLHNQEVNAVVLGPDFGAQMRAQFEVDLAASRQVMLEAWRDRPLGLRLKETFARLWAYWL